MIFMPNMFWAARTLQSLSSVGFWRWAFRTTSFLLHVRKWKIFVNSSILMVDEKFSNSHTKGISYGVWLGYSRAGTFKSHLALSSKGMNKWMETGLCKRIDSSADRQISVRYKKKLLFLKMNWQVSKEKKNSRVVFFEVFCLKNSQTSFI